MKKQTAVEWYRNTFFKALQEGITISEGEIIFEQAIAMEREQILAAYREGRTDEQSTIAKWNNRAATCYYNQTYKDESKGQSVGAVLELF